MNQNRNNKIPLIMTTPPLRISLCAEDHPVDKTDPAYRLSKAIDELSVSVNNILKKAGIK